MSLARRRARRLFVPLALSFLGGCAAAPAAPSRPSPAPQPQAVPAERPRPAFATAGWVKPREARLGCVAEALVAPKAYPGMAAVAKIAVAPDGSVEQYQDVSEPEDASGALSEALRQAVEGCAYFSGQDPEGRPATIWLILQVPLKHRAP
jgi:hypothetical protein